MFHPELRMNANLVSDALDSRIAVIADDSSVDHRVGSLTSTICGCGVERAGDVWDGRQRAHRGHRRHVLSGRRGSLTILHGDIVAKGLRHSLLEILEEIVHETLDLSLG